MVSAINPAIPIDGIDSDKAEFRANFQAAKDELEAIQLVVPVEITVSGDAQIAHAGPNVLVVGNSGSAITYTIQPVTTIGIPRFSVINLARRGVGAFNIAAGDGVTLNLPADRTASIRAQYSGASLHHDPLNTWTMYGDLT